MDKITVVCHKDHDRGYEDFQGKCLLCVVDELMLEMGNLMIQKQRAEKRNAALAQQEPVAWLSTDCIGERYLCFTKPKDNDPVQPLYTTPPKREWVGLTDEQVEDDWERITQHSIFGGDRSDGRAMYISPDEVIEFSRAIEAKLREKNHG